MSLLIPTVTDYEDAHGQESEEVTYQEKLTQLSDKKDSNGNLVYPWTFETINGFFKQSDPSTDDLKFNYATEDFGRTKSWPEIIEELERLNKEAGENECYKLMFFARHGQGFHNVCVNKYGLDEWHRKWHALSTDGEIVWAPDPMLTDLGVDQAKENNQAWKAQIAQGAPIPAKFYVSPLQRSSYTLVYTWGDIKPEEKRPLVTDSIRETIGINLCDKRSTKSVIRERFDKHGFIIDDLLTEEDELYERDTREQLHEQAIRVNGFLQGLFNEDWDLKASALDEKKKLQNSVISTTSHAGTIRSFIMVLGHRHFTISTGGMIPILVKGTRKLD